MINDRKKISIVMGSKSDEKIMKKAADILEEFEVGYEVKILSAHRMPNKNLGFAKNAQSEGI